MDGNFEKFFSALLFDTGSCLERDVLRNLKSVIKTEYNRIWELPFGVVNEVALRYCFFCREYTPTNAEDSCVICGLSKQNRK